MAQEWMKRFEDECEAAGLPVHGKKSVNGAVRAEVQGFAIDGETRWWGASADRRWQVPQAAWWAVLGLRSAPVR
eukprot:11223296-Lingulodinium_polyedra.AAC.1